MKPYFAEVDPSQKKTIDDLVAIASRIRPTDRLELAATSGIQDATVSILAIARMPNQRLWLFYDAQGEPQGAFGLIIEDNYMGIPWLISSDFLFDNSLTFLKGSKAVMETFTELDLFMIGNVWVDHTRSIKWLKWLGFDVVTTQTYIYHDPDMEFYRFYHRSK